MSRLDVFRASSASLLWPPVWRIRVFHAANETASIVAWNASIQHIRRNPPPPNNVLLRILSNNQYFYINSFGESKWKVLPMAVKMHHVSKYTRTSTRNDLWTLFLHTAITALDARQYLPCVLWHYTLPEPSVMKHLQVCRKTTQEIIKALHYDVAALIMQPFPFQMSNSDKYQKARPFCYS
jgi:hypothetical protein